MSKVIVFGSLNMELSMECDRIPHASESVMGTDFITNPGGRGGNQAIAAARMGAETYMIGTVGPDNFGRKIISSLVRYGVSTENIVISTKKKTGVSMRLRSDNDQRSIVFSGANVRTDLAHVRATLMGIAAPGDVFLTQLECDYYTTMQAIIFAKERGLYTVLNPTPAMEILPETLACVDLLVLNEKECETLTGYDPADQANLKLALASLLELGVGKVVVTLGNKGSATLIDGKVITVPAYYVKSVDTTGAGDAYLGALMTQYVYGKSLVESMQIASAAGALATLKYGSHKSMPSIDEVLAFVAENAEADE